MAKNIFDFTEKTDLNPDDLVHIGVKPVNEASPALQDRSIKIVDFYNVMNLQGALSGSPVVAGDNLSANTRETLTTYGAQYGQVGTLSESAGTITITGTAVYRIQLGLVAHIPAADNFTMAAYLVWGGGEIVLSGTSIPSASGSAPDTTVNLSGVSMLNLTAGDVLTIEVEASAALPNITFPNGFFEIQPTTISSDLF